MRSSAVKTALQTLIATLAAMIKSRNNLVLENIALRHQVVVLQRKQTRPRLRRADRMFWMLLSRLWFGWKEALAIVKPETVVAWHRAGFRLCWRWKSRPRGRATSGPVHSLLQWVNGFVTCIRRFRKRPTGARLTESVGFNRVRVKVAMQIKRVVEI